MTAPVGGVFYYEKKYDDRKGTKVPQFGITNQPYSQAYGGQLSAADNINANFGKYYSSEFNDYDVLCTQAGGLAALNNTLVNCRLPAWSPIRAPGTAGQRTFAVRLYYRVRNNAGAAYLNGIATLDPTALTANLTDNMSGAVVGTFTVATGAWVLNAIDETGVASIFENNTVVWAQYYVNWELVGYTTGAEIPSIGLDISLQTVQAESRKLKARWSVEAVDDLRALHGMDAETELVSTFANEVMLEVDREIVDALVTGARFAATAAYANTVPGEIECIRRMLTQVSAVAAEIHRASGRAPANFLVVSTAVGALLDQLSTHGDYASIEQNVQSPSYGPLTSDFGIARVGTLLKRYAVYQDPYMAADKILVGLKGNNFLDAGFVYAPYVPLEVTPTFMDPADFTFRKGVRTRYATKMLRPEYYGVVTVTGLPTVTVV